MPCLFGIFCLRAGAFAFFPQAAQDPGELGEYLTRLRECLGLLPSFFWGDLNSLSGKYSSHSVRHSSGMQTFVIIFPEDVRVYRKEFELHGAREGVCKSMSRCISNLVVKALCREEVKPSSQSHFEDVAVLSLYKKYKQPLLLTSN